MTGQAHQKQITLLSDGNTKLQAPNIKQTPKTKPQVGPV
jgi:hypothetical protein